MLIQSGFDGGGPCQQMGEDTSPQRAAHGLDAGVGGTDADDVPTAFQEFQRDLDGEILV